MYSLLFSSVVNLYFSSGWSSQSKILLVQHGTHAGLSPVINPKLDLKDHCQFGVCVLSRMGGNKMLALLGLAGTISDFLLMQYGTV